MVIDPGRDSRVGSDQHGKPMFDGPEDSTEKMEVQHARSPEPAVIGNRDQGVRICTLGSQVLKLVPNQVGHRTLEADVGNQGPVFRLERNGLFSRSQATTDR